MKATKQYLQFITELKQSIIQSRYQAARLANREQLYLYLKTGQMLTQKIDAEKWGAKVIEQISTDLQKQLPGLNGFSYRNLMKMKQFYADYQPLSILPLPKTELATMNAEAIMPSKTAELLFDELDAFWLVSFSHHIVLLGKCKSLEERLFYMAQTASQYWSVILLEHQINAGLFQKQGKLPNNFSKTLPDRLKPSALQVFKDEYLLDFISIEDSDDERDIENKVVSEIRDFILRLGKGFSFIGNQYRVEVDGEEFFIDLLFFNRHLQCLVAFELKKGKFRPKYTGQLNFYLNVLDEKIRLPHENSSIGFVLCKEKNNTVVEFSIKSVDKAMGVATFKTTKQMPNEIKRVMPDSEELRKFVVILNTCLNISLHNLIVYLRNQGSTPCSSTKIITKLY
jgi:predicted nuclease of restriction endonuclease-like (RecB) superfamily